MHFAPQSRFVFHEGENIVKHWVHYEDMRPNEQLVDGLWIPGNWKCVSPRKHKLTGRCVALINYIYSDDFYNFGYKLMTPTNL